MRASWIARESARSPIQTCVSVRTSVTTYRSTSNPGSVRHRSMRSELPSSHHRAFPRHAPAKSNCTHVRHAGNASRSIRRWISQMSRPGSRSSSCNCPRTHRCPQTPRPSMSGRNSHPAGVSSYEFERRRSPWCVTIPARSSV